MGDAADVAVNIKSHGKAEHLELAAAGIDHIGIIDRRPFHAALTVSISSGFNSRTLLVMAVLQIKPG
jgi:hypothetical protein